MKRHTIYILSLLLILAIAGCASRKKNTAQTRMYHSFFARYNTFYNGNVAFRKAAKAQIEGHKDNYLEILPYLIISDKNTQGIGDGDYDKAIDKSQKAIKNHSIKKKPRRETGKKLTEKKKRFYAQKEFNPFLWRAWIMLADAYFGKGEFTEAASTYIYIGKLYENNPDVLAQARLGLAQCYTEMGWLYEAEDLLSRINRDSMPQEHANTQARAQANLLIRQGRYSEALPYMEKAARRKGTETMERAREYYLMGQLYQLTGDNGKAFRSFGKVISLSPPYELEVNARIRQTETMSGKDRKSIVRKLERMIKSPKNEEYLSQLFYALGNVHLNAGDTAKAVETYETGVAKGKDGGYGAGMLHLSLANIYWHQQKYSKAATNYEKALAIIDKESKNYNAYQQRSEILSELAPHTDIIEESSRFLYWSSLTRQELAPLIAQKIKEAEFEAELQKIIDKKNQKEQSGSELANANTAANMSTPQNDGQSKWYFYNPQLVAQGITNFTKTWGDRKLKDFWRLSRVELTAAMFNNDSTSVAGDSLSTDSLATDTTGIESVETMSDTLSTDPTTREYWIQRIPVTEEQKQALHSKLSDALFGAALIFEEKMGNKEAAMAHWERLVNEYPQYPRLAEAYYHLFLCSARWGESDKAALYKELLIAHYPDSSMTKRIQDPDFFLSEATKRHKEDSLYVQSYAQYCAQEYDSAIANSSYAIDRYPKGAHRARFMFVNALAKLYSNRTEEALEALQLLLSEYPKDSISDIAKEMNSGIKEGRLLHSGITTSIWERRLDGNIKEGSDSLPTFSSERNEPYYFILAFPNDSVYEKRLLFEVARYNFSRYMVRNFTLEFERQEHITLLQVKEFLNFDETFLYSKRLYANSEMSQLLQGINAIIISKSNLELLLKHYTLGDYRTFYEKNLLSIPEPEIKGYTLDEPAYE